MANLLIKTILDSLVNSYNSGACDNISEQEQEELLNSLASIKAKLEGKLDIVYTIEETRRYLNCTRLTLNNYVNKGLLHPKKHLGGVLEFKKRELDNFICETKRKKV